MANESHICKFVSLRISTKTGQKRLQSWVLDGGNIPAYMMDERNMCKTRWDNLTEYMFFLLSDMVVHSLGACIAKVCIGFFECLTRIWVSGKLICLSRTSRI